MGRIDIDDGGGRSCGIGGSNPGLSTIGMIVPFLVAGFRKFSSRVLMDMEALPDAATNAER